jgi:hypothetical protein
MKKSTAKEVPQIDKEFRQGLWKSHKEGICDAIILKVEGKEFKVG